MTGSWIQMYCGDRTNGLQRQSREHFPLDEFSLLKRELIISVSFVRRVKEFSPDPFDAMVCIRLRIMRASFSSWAHLLSFCLCLTSLHKMIEQFWSTQERAWMQTTANIQRHFLHVFLWAQPRMWSIAFFSCEQFLSGHWLQRHDTACFRSSFKHWRSDILSQSSLLFHVWCIWCSWPNSS